MTIKLKEIRKNRGMTQAELADASGVSRATIIRIERNECQSITTGTIMLLCDALKCSTTDLLCS